MAIAIVQTKGNATSGGPLNLTLDATPTVGNLIAVWQACRNSQEPLLPTGFTFVDTTFVSAQFSSGSFNDNGRWAYRVVQSGDTATIANVWSTNCFAVELSGAGALDTFSARSLVTTNPLVSTAVTPSGSCIILGGFVWFSPDGGTTETVVPDADTTELWDSEQDVTFHPVSFVGYRLVTSPSGSYTVGGTASLSPTSGWGAQAVVFIAGPEPGVWIDFDGDGFDPETTDSASDPLLTREMPQLASAGLSDNVTTRVTGLTWRRGGSYDHVGSDGPGGATIMLNNFDGRFDPDNAAGPLYGKLVPGLPVWVGVIASTWALSGSGTVAGEFGGYVQTWNPTVDASGKRIVEVICEDALGRYRRVPITVAPSLTRSHGALRSAILDAAGESGARRNLEAESGMLAISAVDSRDALSVLEELNQATASRHFVAPGDSKEAWYDYTVVNKFHALDAAVAETINADDVVDISGWTVTDENLIQQQRASVTPISVTSNNEAIWVSEQVPIVVSNTSHRVIWAEFRDYVFNASLDTNVSAGAISSTLTNFGKTAKIEIWATTASATIGKLQVLGQQVVRGDTEQVIAGSTTAGARAGSTITSDFIGSLGMAQGICDFIVWKFGTRLKRPSFTVGGDTATTRTTLATRDIYDVVNLVVDKLSVTSRRLEIVGLDGTLVPGRYASVVFRVQETPNQTALHYFTVGTDNVGSAIPIAPF
jgi:hypothetical protein